MSGAGRLRHRLFLEEPADTPDGAGGRVRAWAMLAAMWGEVRPRRSTERPLADALRSEVTHRITIRYRDGVRPDMRFTQAARVFRILAVSDPDGRRTWLHCDAVEEIGG